MLVQSGAQVEIISQLEQKTIFCLGKELKSERLLHLVLTNGNSHSVYLLLFVDTFFGILSLG